MLLLIKANIRKNKSSSVTLVCLILLSVVLLYSSMMVLFELDGVVDNINDTNHGADYLTVVPEKLEATVTNKLKKLSNFKTCEAEPVINTYGTIQNKKVEKTPQNSQLILLNEQHNRSMSQIHIVDELKVRTKDSILVPYCLKASYHYRVGDSITIKLNGTTRQYKINGFIQDVLFSTPMNIDCYILYIDKKAFQEIYKQAPAIEKRSYIKVRLKQGSDTSEFDDQFVKQVLAKKEIDASNMLQMDYDSSKVGTTTMIKIIAMVLVAFAVLIIVISLFVIRFSIITHIEEGIKNIGSMQAAGYTSKMIRTALMNQFLVLTLVGYIAGIFIAFAVSGLFTELVSTTIGMQWKAEISIPSAVLAFVIVFLFVVLVALKVSQRLKKITPIIAIRNGLSSYNFEKNYLPLEHVNGNLNLILGLKQMFHSRKQNTSICLIGIITSFTIAASLAIFHNFTGDNSKIISMVGLEKSNITITCSSEKESNEVIGKLKQYSEVKKVLRVDYRDVFLKFRGKEISTSAQVCDDFSQLEVSTLAEGRFPRHDDEIALSYLNAQKLGAELGDMITLEGKEGNINYIVVGFTQHINHLGSSCSLITEGMRRGDHNYYENLVYIYTKKGIHVNRFLKKLESDLGHDTLSYINMDEAFTNTLKSVRTVAEVLCYFLITIAVAVIALILYYIVKVKLTREKVQLGIKKAVGFTTRQLMIQNVISFCVPLVLSYFAGTLLLVALSTRLFTLMFSVCGFRSYSLALSTTSNVLSVIGLTAFSILITLAVSFRIRKINPRQLFLD